LIVAGRESFLSEALDAIWAKNAYADIPGRYPRPSLEDAVAREPDVILVLAHPGGEAESAKMLARWREFQGLRAVKSGNVRTLDAETLLRPTLRLLDGLSRLEKAVYGAG